MKLVRLDVILSITGTRRLHAYTNNQHHVRSVSDSPYTRDSSSIISHRRLGQDAIHVIQHRSEAYAVASRRDRAHYRNPGRHPQNRKYVNLLQRHRRRSDPRPQATCSEIRRSSDMWLLRYACRQTDKQKSLPQYSAPLRRAKYSNTKQKAVLSQR